MIKKYGENNITQMTRLYIEYAHEAQTSVYHTLVTIRTFHTQKIYLNIKHFTKNSVQCYTTTERSIAEIAQPNPFSNCIT